MRRACLLIAAALCLTCASGEPVRGPRAPGSRPEAPPFAERADVFRGGLVAPWTDWGWAKRDVKSAPARVQMKGYAGWIVAAPGYDQLPDALLIRFRAPPARGDFLEVRLGHKSKSSFPRIKVGPAHRRTLEDSEEVLLEMSALNPDGLPFDRMVLKPFKELGDTWVEFEEIALLCREACGRPRAEERAVFPARPAVFTVRCEAPRSISDGVYGVALDVLRDRKQQWLWELKPGARRWGGNANSRFNFKRGAWNTANDWFFQNVDYMGKARKGGWTWRTFLEENRAHDAQTALSLPLLGWVAKDTEANGFPVSVYGAQQRSDPHRPDAGNGKSRAGKKLKPGPPSRTSVEAGPAFIADWVREVRKVEGGAQVYILGNEPMLWHDTHRDVHPAPVSYDELLGKHIDAARAIKKVDPAAKIAGPALWGWPAYHFSAVDAEKGFWRRPDRLAHGNQAFLSWFLEKLRDHERRTGEKLIDFVDVHFYPEGLYNKKVDSETARRRVRSARSLWDPGYVEESYIKEAVELVPRMRRTIDEAYPGLGLIIGEYNFGGEQHWSGALATAEALGTFGRLGVDYAFYWTYPPKGSASWWAFRAYTDYDGAGARFPGGSIPARAPEGARVYAGVDDERVVAVLVNQRPRAGLQASVDFKGCGDLGNARAFTWAPGAKGLEGAEATRKGSRARLMLPATSVSVLEVRRAQPQ